MGILIFTKFLNQKVLQNIHKVVDANCPKVVLYIEIMAFGDC